MSDMKSDKTDMDFEAALKRLDQISSLLEKEGVSLEESLALYEEGVRLVRACTEKLEKAERRVSVLRASDGGEIEEVDFLSDNGEK